MNAKANILSGAFRRIGGILAILSIALTAGCMDITGRGPAPLEKTIDPVRETDHPRSGHVYCMRGWLGIFSTGIDDLAVKIDKEVAAVSVADEEWGRLKNFLITEKKAGRINEPLVLVGHSWGADDQIRVAEDLGKAGITVDLLITLDPVTPPPVPANVKRCLNIYKSHPITDPVPLWRGVAIDQKATKVPVKNINLREDKVGFETDSIDHINIEKSPGVHEIVLEAIRTVCPPRNPSNSQLGTAIRTTPSGSPVPLDTIEPTKAHVPAQ